MTPLASHILRGTLGLVAAPALLVAAACTGPPGIGGPCQAFNSGSDPCKQQLYFPSGLTRDPDVPVLYVSNGNSDLRYSGGTLATVDAAFFQCALDYVRRGYVPPTGADPCVAYADHLKLDPADLAKALVTTRPARQATSCGAGLAAAVDPSGNSYCCPTGMVVGATRVGGVDVCSRCRTDYDFDPARDGELAGAEKLGIQPKTVWKTRVT